jgi:hypothetical protein
MNEDNYRLIKAILLTILTVGILILCFLFIYQRGCLGRPVVPYYHDDYGHGRHWRR